MKPKNRPISEFMPPKPDSSVIVIRCQAEVRRRMNELAKKKQTSLNKLLIAAMARLLAEEGRS
jgi:predicted HicB family RNase H-like nuclease